MAYQLRTPQSHPDGYNGLYSAQELKKGIIQFILKDRQENGVRLLSTPDIILGLKNLYNIEFDHDSVEYVMKNMLSKEGAKQVSTTQVDIVKKKCEDGENRNFVAAYEHIKPNIPQNLTEEQLNKLYSKLSLAFAMGATYNPGTFPEFKKNSGY